MRKRISIILVVSILIVAVLASFAGCTSKLTVDEGMNDLKESIKATNDAKQYYIRTVKVEDPQTSYEVKYNVELEDPDKREGDIKSARITVVTTENAKTSYKVKVWGDSLKKGVKEKKATDADWKNDYAFYAKDGNTFDMASATAMTYDEFNNDPFLLGVDKHDLIAKLDLLIASGVEANNITRQGKVTNYYFDDIGAANATIFGYEVKEGTPNSLFIETVDGHISKVSDKANGGSLVIYLTMQGPRIKVPQWTEA